MKDARFSRPLINFLFHKVSFAKIVGNHIQVMMIEILDGQGLNIYEIHTHRNGYFITNLTGINHNS